MRLKCIKLAGFKSFVDPTTVNFPSNLCAVVGPNGCGKSNIIDAVRWVMGESSAKNLRGENMTDVIFNGSSGRKPVGQASIELVFDNSDGTLLGEYASFTEISIKRKVTRDGENSYYLNGTKCRRRDITDIFLGTGLGPRSYAIIEQGMISKLIEAKPEELRVYIEEAAGISKYKERRRDTESRMRRTQENLERLTDIREELERQLSRLQRQAQSAEKYAEYKQEERLLKAQLQALKYQQLDDQAKAKQLGIRDLELRMEAFITDQVNKDTQIEKYRSQYTELGDKFNEVQGRYYSIGADISRLEQSIQHANERARQLQTDLDQTNRDCKEAEESLLIDAQKAEAWEAELLELEPELEMVKAAEETSGESLIDAEESMQRWQNDWDSFNQRAAEPRQRAEVQQSRIQHLEQVQQRLLQRIEKLREEKNSLQSDGEDEAIGQLTEQLAELDLVADEKREQVELIGEQLDQQRNRVQQLQGELDSSRGKLQTMRGRHASLEALQQAALGEKNKAVKEWLVQQGFTANARLAETISVAEGWDKALETVLGNALQAVCVDGIDASAGLLGELTQGELVLFDTRQRALSDSATKAPLLADKVTASWDVPGLLAGIYIAEDLSTALALRRQLSGHESVVTRDGIWLSAHWVRVARDSDASSGVIARRQELEELTAAIEDAEAAVADLSEQLEGARSTIKTLENQREQLRRDADEQNRRYGELRSQLSARQVRVEQTNMRRERLDNEIREAREQMEQEAEHLSEARMILSEAIDMMEQDTDQRESLLQQRDDIRAGLDTARQRARHDKDKAHELAMRFQSVKTQLDAIRLGIGRLREQTARLQERREQLVASIADNRDPVEEFKLELEASLAKRLAVESSLAEARRALETVEQELRQSEQARHRAEQEVQAVRAHLEQERLTAQMFEVQRAGIAEQLAEEELNLDIILAEMPDGTEIKPLEEELEAIAGRIARLGPINLAAIDEYKTESERKGYLDAQNADLVEALETLENAIKRIDRETRTRFKETFDQVNKSLQELFPKVFGGGHAYLELTGEELLDTGIAIMARPPGKRNSTIHLLSGGEKALTAIALVFSIFRLNPAPFCMLDEVDAPLDDANVGRYARMVEEMSEHVQFIYITHNKNAMEMAHQLLGVTMHEPGVSRLVTVDVDEAAELAAV
ncbi:chromosome segregation protein SMC [Cellvibrio japonicus]|uniref:Chromosome partition protein Smc n=1 Tax=Cellvibrio japonicus (strain Ueda107) TaxID=498211 RepID=B3PGR0_CELJU|nr:chromosome segregation protein SMC [Cellvibrio japonicus]ACE83378.1 chromosome segregation protein SMC [Cellvibrio japonicus Ueda107]QEI12405.1 chromosome segregation protein SMC [Cellvibrio japonicus]QEI15978.1 chromosome segregation protein SMC [Cellvibrio japonicus]QEI19557.1 chromosome segregation protein SMC [Cellvibrio japonicus]